MHEVIKINLDNEMDLILAHKRTMKIAELCGLQSSSQTRFATAVSEISRCAIANGTESILTLGINVIKATQKEILAVVSDSVDIKKCSPEAYSYAARISGTIDYENSGGKFITKISQTVAAPGLLSDNKINGFKDYFKTEPPLSPYDEIRKKNIELIALSEKLVESENRYKQLTKTLPVLICVADDRNRILLTNNWLNDYLETPITVFDKNAISANIHRSDAEALIQGWEKAKKGASAYYGQVRIKKGTEYIWHLVSIIPNKSEDGNSTSWLIFFVDINAQKLVDMTLRDNTELRKMQSELETTNSQLSFKNKELEQFAFIASHDLQEPLRKIRMMISRSVDRVSPEERENLYLDRISQAANRMSTLIQDVLQYSRADTGNLFTEFKLQSVLDETLGDLSLIIEEKSAIIEIDEMPTVYGIETQLRQLFYNLVNNALKFNRSRPIVTISADIVNGNDLDVNDFVEEYHHIAVSDNGIGMDHEYSDRIFNMFQRLHERDLYGGNGIGLALCRRVVENHNGLLQFTSEVGVGTVFHIYLPVKSS